MFKIRNDRFLSLLLYAGGQLNCIRYRENEYRSLECYLVLAKSDI